MSRRNFGGPHTRLPFVSLSRLIDHSAGWAVRKALGWDFFSALPRVDIGKVLAAVTSSPSCPAILKHNGYLDFPLLGFFFEAAVISTSRPYFSRKPSASFSAIALW